MDNTHLTSIPIHFGETRVAETERRGNYMVECPVEQRIYYINNGVKAVSVGLRSGLKFPVPGQATWGSSDDFVVRLELIFRAEVKIDVQRVLSVVDDSSTPELKAMRASLEAQLKHTTSQQGVTLVLEYPISMQLLHSYGGSIYLHELDCVVSVLPAELMPPHPYSDEGRKSQTVAGNPVAQGGAAFGYQVEIVDNLGKYGSRFLNIGGCVYKVNPIKDPVRRDGVYILSNYAANGEISPEGVRHTHYPFDLAERDLGLYRTYEEALHLGDIAQARKERLASLEHENATMRLELQNAKGKHELEMVEKNRLLKDLEAERDRLAVRTQMLEHDMAMERQRLKDYYDSKSYQRKDTSEALKILPTLLLGIGTLLMALKSFMPSPAGGETAKLLMAL